MKKLIAAFALCAASSAALSAEPTTAVNAEKMYNALAYHMTTTYACQDVLGTKEDFQSAKTMMTDFLKQALEDDNMTPAEGADKIEQNIKQAGVAKKTKDMFVKNKLTAEQQKQYCQALEVNSFRQVAYILRPDLAEQAKQAQAKAAASTKK